MGRTEHARLITDLQSQSLLHHADVNKIADGLDRQVYGAVKYVGGDGIIQGGEVLQTGQVGPTLALAGGFVGMTTAPQAISGLQDDYVNYVWCVRVDPPTSGPHKDDPAYATTFNAGLLQFVAADSQPPNSILLGTLPVDAGGNPGTPDNEVLDRVEVLPAGVKCWRGYTVITDLLEGEEQFVYVDHSTDVTFRAALLLDYYNPKPADDGGFAVERLENAQTDRFGFLVRNVGTGGDPYYGETTVTIYWARWGIPGAIITAHD